MKAKVIFDLDDEDDRHSYKMANAARAMNLAIWNYDQWLRGQIKHCDRNELQEARDKLYECLDDEGLVLD